MVFPDVSVQYLYNYYENIDECIFLVTALSERTIHTMRQHIANANPKLKIAYIVNQNGQLPIEDKSIDLVIDYMGTTNLGFFSNTHYFDIINSYISDDAIIIGAFEYYKKGINSLKKIHKEYSNASEKVMTLEFTNYALKTNDFQIEKKEDINEGYDPGHFFEYHIPSDVRTTTVYVAKWKAKKHPSV